MCENSKSRGFSLVEMLIYITIMVLMLGVIMSVVVSVVSVGRVIEALRNVENSALSSMERITREIREADSINLGLSVFDSNPGRLVLDSLDTNGNPRTVEFYLSSGQLFLNENGVNTGPLSQTDAVISNLTFRRFSGSNSEGVRTEITIGSGTSTYYRVNKFYFSALLR